MFQFTFQAYSQSSIHSQKLQTLISLLKWRERAYYRLSFLRKKPEKSAEIEPQNQFRHYKVHHKVRHLVRVEQEVLRQGTPSDPSRSVEQGAS